MPPLSFLDILFLLLVGFFTLKGLWRGFIRELAGLAGLYAGFVAANRYHPLLIPYLRPYLTDASYLTPAAWALTFALTIVAVWLVAVVLTGFAKVTLLGGVNAFGGGIFGLGKGVLACAGVLLVLTTLVPKAEFLEESRLAPRLKPVADWMNALLPEDVREQARQLGADMSRTPPPPPTPGSSGGSSAGSKSPKQQAKP